MVSIPYFPYVSNEVVEYSTSQKTTTAYRDPLSIWLPIEVKLVAMPSMPLAIYMHTNPAAWYGVAENEPVLVQEYEKDLL